MNDAVTSWPIHARNFTMAAALAAAIGFAGGPARLQADAGTLPPPPADGTLGFVVDLFQTPIVDGRDACPNGPALTLRESFLADQSPEERNRLSREENSEELARRWKALASGPNGTNICSQPDMFDRPMIRTVQSTSAWGLDLDQGGGEGCTHAEFTSPLGETGIDNQEYRALGCGATVRDRDGNGGEQSAGLRQFHASGEWTQVLLLRGVDSLENDPAVEVVYGNTPDRPMLDAQGRFLSGASYTISDAPPRNRNVLRGRIENGVLTTAPQDIVLTQTWGQGGAKDIRGNRTKYTYRFGRLRLSFRADGSLGGLVGGYRPIIEPIQSPTLGGIGSAIVAGIDCAGQLATLRNLADGVRDPATGKCTAISSAMRINAIQAFVNDVPGAAR